MTRRALTAAQWRTAFIGGLLASASALPVQAATADATANAQTGVAAVGEVIVTATKREENLQNVPVSVQALTPTILTQHQVTSADDYIKLLPSVSFQSFGPGQSQLYFRGITSGGDGLHIGSEPATGVYVDEVPLTTIANTVDLHIYDIARVEALSGPQGTLFGASSLSGTLRIITNAPNPAAFSAGVDAQVDGYTGHGAGGIIEGYVNVPINEKVAIRLVGFDEHEGGYIDNIFKTRTFQLDPGSIPPNDTLTENNAAFVKKNFNDVTTYGGRAELKIDLDDSWTVEPAVIYQHQQANGNFLANPALGDLKVADFSPDINVDEWYLASMTIKGKIANWDVLYAGGWFSRSVLNRADYSYYAVAYDAAGYTSYVTFPDGHGGFLDPDQQFNSFDAYTKQSHEFRVSSPADQPIRFLGGLFYERQTNLTTSNYVVPGLGASGDPRAVPTAGDDIFYKHLNRVDRDFALFGELAWDIRPNLTLTLGGRYFTAHNTLFGFSGFAGNATDPAVCFPTTAITQVPCADVNGSVKESGETHKVNLSWKVDPERMLYVTYSTGFRPGGVNRLALAPPYKPDTVDNYEVGWKTTWLDGRLRFNGALFDEEWHGVQYALSPPGFAGVTIIDNAGDARSYGLEGDLAWRVTEDLTLSASGTVLHAALTQNFCNFDSAGVPTGCAPKGTRLPIQPDYKLNASARYQFMLGDFKSFFEGDLQAQGQSTSALFTADEAALGPTSAFATFDLSAGFGKDDWTLSVFVQNLFDKRGVLSKNTDCVVSICGGFPLDYYAKPRFIGARLSAKFD
ncbi:MAG TPA: TonB-dependent receptor [Caulobacteraceae bacterium]|nr:TonB-dependent receptor [Caulobacteraceae bacterium]